MTLRTRWSLANLGRHCSFRQFGALAFLHRFSAGARMDIEVRIGTEPIPGVEPCFISERRGGPPRYWPQHHFGTEFQRRAPARLGEVLTWRLARRRQRRVEVSTNPKFVVCRSLSDGLRGRSTPQPLSQSASGLSSRVPRLPTSARSALARFAFH